MVEPDVVESGNLSDFTVVSDEGTDKVSQIFSDTTCILVGMCSLLRKYFVLYLK